MNVTLWHDCLGSHLNSHATLRLLRRDAFGTIKICDGLPRIDVNLILVGVLWRALGACHHFVRLVIGKPGRNQIEVIAAVDDLDSAHRLKVDHGGLTWKKVANA